jgi:biotin carboxylase
LILEKCKEIGIDGITTIATDIAMPTVNFIADALGLVGNSLEATLKSTDKYEMRRTLANAGLPCPKFYMLEESKTTIPNLPFPLIIKPTDRSGSRGVSKVENLNDFEISVKKALNHSISKKVVVEEYITTKREFSVECISFNRQVYPLAITDKITTGPPYFCELEHHQPAEIDQKLKTEIFDLTTKAIHALNLNYGASHTEIILNYDDSLYLVEVAGRMGGDFIGSHLVQLSTGFDFLKAVIEVALNIFDFSHYNINKNIQYSGVKFVTPRSGKIISIIDNTQENPDIVHVELLKNQNDIIDDVLDASDKRAAAILYKSHKKNISLEKHLLFKTF